MFAVLSVWQYSYLAKRYQIIGGLSSAFGFFCEFFSDFFSGKIPHYPVSPQSSFSFFYGGFRQKNSGAFFCRHLRRRYAIL
jgi:hypothetical protein